MFSCKWETGPYVVQAFFGGEARSGGASLEIDYNSLKPHEPSLVFKWVLFPGRIDILSVGFCGERKTGVPGEKIPVMLLLPCE